MHSASRITKVLIIAATASLLVATDAAATSFTARTSLTISAPDRVDAGHSFTISGFLRSTRHFCRADSKIALIKVGTGVIDHDTTSENGHYEFRTRIHHGDSKFYTKFNGKVRGTHPNIRVCKDSQSRTVTVHAH